MNMNIVIKRKGGGGILYHHKTMCVFLSFYNTLDKTRREQTGRRRGAPNRGYLIGSRTRKPQVAHSL